ncbi:unnamed protein product [Arabidopsis lyrata]|nr:unnamed protein product [Arabidopsis lyrata]
MFDGKPLQSPNLFRRIFTLRFSPVAVEHVRCLSTSITEDAFEQSSSRGTDHDGFNPQAFQIDRRNSRSQIPIRRGSIRLSQNRHVWY